MNPRRCFSFIGLAFVLALSTPAQIDGPEPLSDPKLPNGKSQRTEILKSEHERSLRDAADLVKLATEVQIDLEKSDHKVVSVSTLKKLEDIEKRAKRIRGRLMRF